MVAMIFVFRELVTYCRALIVSCSCRRSYMVIINNNLVHEQIASGHALSLSPQPGTIPGLWEWVVRA